MVVDVIFLFFKNLIKTHFTNLRLYSSFVQITIFFGLRVYISGITKCVTEFVTLAYMILNYKSVMDNFKFMSRQAHLKSSMLQ